MKRRQPPCLINTASAIRGKWQTDAAGDGAEWVTVIPLRQSRPRMVFEVEKSVDKVELHNRAQGWYIVRAR